MWEIRRYRKEDKEAWDAFVETSRNATFLFKRNYMDYHSHRFTDHSLLAYRNGKLMAALPANIVGSTLWSHQGLTYGGWMWNYRGLDTNEIFDLWRSWLEYSAKEGIENIIYKPLPYIYSEMPSEEDRYMLFLSGAGMRFTNISTAIDLEANPGFDKLQKRHLKKAADEFEIRVIDINDAAGLSAFYGMLEECLRQRHDEVPVHSMDELKQLIGKFEDNIIIYGSFSRESDELMAGVCIYETGICAHCQYIATTPEGRDKNALSPLFATLIERYEEYGVRYFDFGISNEEGGRLLNTGLNRQKTSYGGSGVAYTCHEISVNAALASLPTSLWPPR